MGEGSGLLDTKVLEREMTPYWPQQHKTGQFCLSTEVSCVKHLTVITIKCNKAMSREKVTLQQNICFQKVTYYTVNIPLIFCFLVLMGQRVYRLYLSPLIVMWQPLPIIKGQGSQTTLLLFYVGKVPVFQVWTLQGWEGNDQQTFDGFLLHAQLSGPLSEMYDQSPDQNASQNTQSTQLEKTPQALTLTTQSGGRNVHPSSWSSVASNAIRAVREWEWGTKG